MSENELNDVEKNSAEENDNIEVEPLTDEEMDSVPGGAAGEGFSSICSAVWCS